MMLAQVLSDTQSVFVTSAVIAAGIAAIASVATTWINRHYQSKDMQQNFDHQKKTDQLTYVRSATAAELERVRDIFANVSLHVFTIKQLLDRTFPFPRASESAQVAAHRLANTSEHQRDFNLANEQILPPLIRLRLLTGVQEIVQTLDAFDKEIEAYSALLIVKRSQPVLQQDMQLALDKVLKLGDDVEQQMRDYLDRHGLPQ
jgi:hypothetical protein